MSDGLCFGAMAEGMETRPTSLFYLSVRVYQRYLIYTSWRIPHCGRAKIEARSQALVVPTELTRSMMICVF